MTDASTSEKTYLRVEDVAKLLSINRSTVFAWIKQGVLIPIRIGGVLRFSADDVERIMKDGKTRGSKRKGKKILLIDDDTLVRDSLVRLLQNAHYEVTAASSGDEALERVGASSFDLIISDIRMPGMNGLETIRAIRRRQKELGRSRSGEMLITGYHDKDPQIEATELAIENCLFKPFNMEDFLTAVQRNIRKAESVD